MRSNSSLATSIAALCIALSAAVSWAFDGRTIDRNPDMCDVDIIDTVAWYSTESLRLTINPWRCGQPVPIPDNATALWIVEDEAGTNWIVNYATAVTPSNAVFTLEAGQGALPPGHDYTGFVDLLQGTTILGVIDRFDVRVLPTSSDTNSIVPAAGTWESLAGAVISNTAAIAEMEANWPKTNAFTQAEMVNGYWTVLGPTWFDSEALFQQAQITELGARWLTGLFSLDFWGTTNKLTADTETGALLFGGKPLASNTNAFTEAEMVNDYWTVLGPTWFDSEAIFQQAQITELGARWLTGLFSLDFWGTTNKLTADTETGQLLYGGQPIGGGGSGSGFPLTEDANFSGYSADDVGSIRLSGSTNLLTYGEGKLLYGGEPIDTGTPNLEAGHAIVLSVNTNTEALVVAVSDNPSFQDMTIRGDLTVVGVEYQNTTIYHTTNVYLGTITNHLYEDRYITNYSWEVHSVVSRTTNYVDEVINVGGDVDHSRAATVKEPSFTIDNTDTNAPVLTGTGDWNLSGAGLIVGTNLDYKISSESVAAVQSANLSSLTLNGNRITAWPTSSVASAWTTIYDDTGATNTPLGAEPLKITASTNHTGVLWMGETNGIKILSIGTMSGGGGGGSGVWTPTNRVVTAASDTVLPTDYLIWMNPSTVQTNQTLVLPVMSSDQSIIVRQLGALYGTSITYGTNSFYISGDGDWVGFDHLVGHGWYWRQ